MATNNSLQEWPPVLIIGYKLCTQFMPVNFVPVFQIVNGKKFKVLVMTYVAKD